MATRIDDVSIFGEYGAEENRLTVALLQVLKVGGEPLIRYFADGLGFPLPSSEIEIFTQADAEGCRPDGLLQSTFSFSLLIESKVKSNAINPRQLAALIDNRARPAGGNVTVLYLTPDVDRPAALPASGVVWANWIRVADLFTTYLQSPDALDDTLLAFLVRQFDTFASNLGVLEERWKPEPSRVLVVAARRARGEARQFGVYACQNHRSFKPSGWIASYADGQIDTLAEIAAAPENDVVLAERPELAELAATQADPESPRCLIRLRNVQAIGPVRNDLTDKNGDTAPYTQGQNRYTTIEKLRAATVTSQL